jgi:hypothetical protein
VIPSLYLIFKFPIVLIFHSFIAQIYWIEEYELICKIIKKNKSYLRVILEGEFGVEISLWIRGMP